MRINLLPKEDRPLKQSQVRWEFLVMLGGVLVLGAALVFSWVEGARLDTLNMARQEALSRETKLQRQIQELNQLRQEITRLEAEEKTYGGLLSHGEHAVALLPEVSSHSQRLLWIERLDFTADTVTISGYTRDVTALSSYLSQLQSYGEEVELTSVLPLDGSDFQVFVIDVKGVRTGASAQLD